MTACAVQGGCGGARTIVLGNKLRKTRGERAGRAGPSVHAASLRATEEIRAKGDAAAAVGPGRGEGEAAGHAASLRAAEEIRGKGES